MAQGEGSPKEDPLFQPYLVRVLKDRPRLVDRGVRQDFLEELEDTLMERRRPDSVAEEAVRSVLDRFTDAAAPAAKKQVQRKAEQANETVLENL